MQMPEEEGNAEEQTVMAAHRQYMACDSPMEFTKSMAGELMGTGS
jgi:hypothetical protein